MKKCLFLTIIIIIAFFVLEACSSNNATTSTTTNVIKEETLKEGDIVEHKLNPNHQKMIIVRILAYNKFEVRCYNYQSDEYQNMFFTPYELKKIIK